MYYKAFFNNQIVDALDNLQCVRYYENIGILRCTEKEVPQGIISSDGQNIWQVDGWPMFPYGTDKNTVRLVEVSEDEYRAIREALDESGGAISVPDPEPEPVDQETLDFVKEQKVSAMGAACEAAIEAGFSISGQDGKEQHFSLAVTDQIMIAQLGLKAQTGGNQLPWHADGEPCKFYTAEEMMNINGRMEQLITYHQTYFNSLKQYILSLDSTGDVSAVQYGMDIPEEYQSEVLKALLGGASGVESNI